MPLKAYGVLVGKIVGKRKAVSSNPHFQIKVEGENGVFYRIAVNVKSKVAPSEVKYFLQDNFQHELVQKIKLANLQPGFHKLTKAPNGLALDYIRYNLFRLEDLVPLPFEVDGPNNDLNDHLDFFVTKAKEDDQAIIYAFGEPWGPETVKDKVFGFLPGRGIHDIHMNQGSEGAFAPTNGIWQDGGMLIYFPATDKWLAFFTAFQSQSFQTDDNGNAIVGGTGPGPGTPPTPSTTAVRIVAAMVNPAGDDAGKEAVYIINLSPNAIPLKGWSIIDKLGKKEVLADSLVLAAHSVLTIRLSGKSAQLGNSGGTITIMDHQNQKMDGVAYTQEQAKQQNYLLNF